MNHWFLLPGGGLPVFFAQKSKKALFIVFCYQGVSITRRSYSPGLYSLGLLLRIPLMYYSLGFLSWVTRQDYSIGLLSCAAQWLARNLVVSI